MAIKEKIAKKADKTRPSRSSGVRSRPEVSVLGKKLQRIRREIEKSGMPLLSEHEIERSRRHRRGGSSLS